MCKGYQEKELDRLKIKAFYVHLAFSRSHTNYSHLVHSLTLHYLPRINGRALEINGSKTRPNSPAFVTLHRVVSPEKVTTGELVYGTRERVRASEGLRFEIYMGDLKVLNGIFRKEEGQNWKIDCTCGLENDDVHEVVKKAEVCVALEGDVAVTSEKVEMVMRRKGVGGRRSIRLKKIPEEREVGNDEYDESDDCCCSDCEGEVEMDGGDLEMDGVRWAVDVGILAVCIGVGYLVSKASSKNLRRKLF